MARLSKEVQLRRAEMVLETFRRMRCRQELFEAVTPFYIFRTDNRQVLARGVVGYEAAKDKANELRKKYGLKWDQVSFKREKSYQSSQKQKSMSGRTTSGRGRYVGGIYRYQTAKGHWKDWDE